MAHHLNTNKQFMVGNGILAFAVIFVVVIFVYMSMRLQREKQEERHFIESYTISLVKGFAGDSISLFVNDSLISNNSFQEALIELAKLESIDLETVSELIGKHSIILKECIISSFVCEMDTCFPVIQNNISNFIL